MSKESKESYIKIGFALFLIATICAIYFFPHQNKSSSSLLNPSDVSEENLIIAPAQAISVENSEQYESVVTVFEKYMLADKTKYDEGKLQESVIGLNPKNRIKNINIEATDGIVEKTPDGSPFFYIEIYPNAQAGNATVTFEFEDGQTVERRLEFGGSSEISFSSLDETRTVNFEGIPGSLGDGIIEKGTPRELSGYKLGNLDLTKADAVFDINARNFLRGGFFPFPDSDENLWLDIGLLNEQQGAGRYIFLAKIDDTWYYATAYFPKDFI